MKVPRCRPVNPSDSASPAAYATQLLWSVPSAGSSSWTSSPRCSSASPARSGDGTDTPTVPRTSATRCCSGSGSASAAANPPVPAVTAAAPSHSFPASEPSNHAGIGAPFPDSLGATPSGLATNSSRPHVMISRPVTVGVALADSAPRRATGLISGALRQDGRLTLRRLLTDGDGPARAAASARSPSAGPAQPRSRSIRRVLFSARRRRVTAVGAPPLVRGRAWRSQDLRLGCRSPNPWWPPPARPKRVTFRSLPCSSGSGRS